MKTIVEADLTTGLPGATGPLSPLVASPDEGARLIRAFVAVKDLELRNAIVKLVEDLAKEI
jgi:hypothetical protein